MVFNVWSIVNNVAMDIGIQVSVSIKLLKCLYKVPVYIIVIMGMGHTALWSQSDESINCGSEVTRQ